MAGVGSYSSVGRNSGLNVGLYYTNDLGDNWTELDALAGQDISGVHVYGHYILASGNERSQQPGVYRSTDCGLTFQLVSVGDGSQTGLPAGIAYDIVSPKWQPNIVFTSIVNAEASGGTSGLYRSDDFGQNWYRVSRPDFEAFLSFEDFDPNDGDDEIKTENIEIATGANGSVFVGIVNEVQGGGLASRLEALFALNVYNPYYWQQLDVPDIHPGGQGYIHFSIAADPYDVNILYVGGDRQDGPLPNAIGANSFTGNLWRGNVTQPSGSQFVHLTHSDSLGPAGGGTASGTAPHADSRDIVFDAWGQLIQVDDGGVYAHTSPRDNTGDWFSLNGNLQGTELKDISYDTVSQIFFGGSQDNANQYQTAPGSATWAALLAGDGGDTAVDTNLAPGFSLRYTSRQFLGGFNYTAWNAAGVLVDFDFLDLRVIDGGPPIEPQFYTPIATNNVAGARIILGGANAVYESFDLGDSLLTVAGIQILGEGIGPIAYGAADNDDVLYFGSGPNVFVRDAVYPDPVVQAVSFPGTTLVVSVEVDPQTAATAYVLTLDGNVFSTTDYGQTWSSITGNLLSLTSTNLIQAEYLENAAGDAIVVGGFGDGNLFIAHEASGFTQWSPLTSGLPSHAIVWDFDYDPATDTLIVGTLGQGAWRIENVVAGP